MGLALALLDGPVVSRHRGAVLGVPGLKLQGAKPLFRSVALALTVPLQSYAVHSLKKSQVYARPLVAMGLLSPNSF